MRYFIGLVLAVVAFGVATLPPAGAAGADSYKIDTVHSTVLVRAKHLGVSYAYVRFNEMAGKIAVDEADPAKSTLEIVIQADSVDSNHEKRDQHLKSPDFLNVKQFPVITFRSTSAKKTGEQQFEVTGELELHGVSKTVTVQVTRTGSGKDPWGGYRTGAEARFTVKRSDFDMNFMLEGISDELDVIVSLEAVKE